MTVKDFAKYVIDNMSRASLANSLNIATKLDNPEYYGFIEFLNEMEYDYLFDIDDTNKIKIKIKDWTKIYQSWSRIRFFCNFS